jgi:hypothetical protein
MPARPIHLLILSLLISGCRGRPSTNAIPNHVTPNEIAIYKAWLQDFHNDSAYSDKMQYIETETWPFDQEPACDQKLLKEGVQPTYLRALRDLGTARYLITPFNIGFARTFDPFLYTVDGNLPEKPFIRHIFSRIAFSPDGKQAFLHVTYINGPGDGQGGYSQDLLATQDGQLWQFRRVGCVGILD